MWGLWVNAGFKWLNETAQPFITEKYLSRWKYGWEREREGERKRHVYTARVRETERDIEKERESESERERKIERYREKELHMFKGDFRSLLLLKKTLI